MRNKNMKWFQMGVQMSFNRSPLFIDGWRMKFDLFYIFRFFWVQTVTKWLVQWLVDVAYTRHLRGYTGPIRGWHVNYRPPTSPQVGRVVGTDHAWLQHGRYRPDQTVNRSTDCPPSTWTQVGDADHSVVSTDRSSGRYCRALEPALADQGNYGHDRSRRSGCHRRWPSAMAVNKHNWKLPRGGDKQSNQKHT
jgi:hypothetical protein